MKFCRKGASKYSWATHMYYIFVVPWSIWKQSSSIYRDKAHCERIMFAMQHYLYSFLSILRWPEITINHSIERLEPQRHTTTCKTAKWRACRSPQDRACSSTDSRIQIIVLAQCIIQTCSEWPWRCTPLLNILNRIGTQTQTTMTSTNNN